MIKVVSEENLSNQYSQRDGNIFTYHRYQIIIQTNRRELDQTELLQAMNYSCF